jgi:hypothetical protein
MPTNVLWQGHEVDAYRISNTSNVENHGAIDAAYERAGMRVGRWGAGDLYSRPDWPATSEIWHHFNHVSGAYNAGLVFWAACQADGTKVAQIVAVNTTTAKYQRLAGGVMVDVGAPFAIQDPNTVVRFDVHHKGTVDGKIEVWYGTVGAQNKVVDAAGDFSGAAAIVRIYHGTNNVGGGYDTSVAHEIVQTTSTLSSTSEIKPPTSQGADADGTGSYLDVDEEVFSDVDIITLSASGHRQSFKSPARLHTQSVVTGVTISCRAWFEAGGPSQIKPYLTIGGVRYYGPAFDLDLVAGAYQYTWAANPATAAAFTPAEASDANLEWGWEAV